MNHVKCCDMKLLAVPCQSHLKTLLFKHARNHVQSDTKKRELLKNPTKIEEIQEKKNY